MLLLFLLPSLIPSLILFYPSVIVFNLLFFSSLFHLTFILTLSYSLLLSPTFFTFILFFSIIYFLLLNSLSFLSVFLSPAFLNKFILSFLWKAKRQFGAVLNLVVFGFIVDFWSSHRTYSQVCWVIIILPRWTDEWGLLFFQTRWASSLFKHISFSPFSLSLHSWKLVLSNITNQQW